MFQRLVVAIVVLTLTACSTVQVMQRPAPAALFAGLEVGDEVEVLGRNGKHYSLEVVRVDAETFSGRESNGKQWRFTPSQVERIEIYKANTEETVAATLGITAAVLLALSLLTGHVFRHAFDNLDGGDD